MCIPCGPLKTGPPPINKTKIKLSSQDKPWQKKRRTRKHVIVRYPTISQQVMGGWAQSNHSCMSYRTFPARQFRRFWSHADTKEALITTHRCGKLNRGSSNSAPYRSHSRCCFRLKTTKGHHPRLATIPRTQSKICDELRPSLFQR